MNEAQSPQPAIEPRKRNKRYLCDMVIGLFALTCIVTVVRRFGIDPYIFFLGVIAYGVPFFLIQFRSWSRWFRPERVPARWPDRYARGKRLQTVKDWLDRTWIFLLCIGFVIRYASSWNGRNVILGVAYGLMFWDGFLKNYIEDRKYIPPPSPPYDPSIRGWGIYTPLHSDLWGERVVPDTEPTEG